MVLRVLQKCRELLNSCRISRERPANDGPEKNTGALRILQNVEGK